MDLYVMSLCPYGIQTENALAPVVEKLGPALDLKIEYIAGEENGTIVSLHEEAEVQGDITQLCAARVAPEKAFKFILCQNRAPREIPGNWEGCAREIGIDAGAMGRCINGDEGKNLLRDSLRRAEKAQVRASPTILIAGKEYEGPRRSSDLLRAVCGAFTTNRPAACAEVKPAPEVKVVILSDARCVPCGRIERIVPHLQAIFPGIKHTMLDYSTPEGKKLFAETGLKHLPAVLFDESVEKEPEGLREIERFLRPAGKYRHLLIGAKFDPTAEICDNGRDDTGDGLVDCADPQCRETLVCRPEIKKRLDVFVMSQCPYGVRALDALKEVLEHFRGQGVTVGIHYIATETPTGIESLHGQPEVDEDIRGVCAMKHYGTRMKFMDYVWCRNKNIRDTDWRACAKDGIDPKVLEKCSTGPEGHGLLRENIKLAERLGIDASPTWLANNKFPFTGLDPETIKTNLCEHNQGLKGCDVKLRGKTEGDESGACGQ